MSTIAFAKGSRIERGHFFALGSGLDVSQDSDGVPTLVASISGGDASTLDGYDSSAFARKAENASITGTWDFLSTPTVNGNAIWHAGTLNPASFARKAENASITGTWNFLSTPTINGNAIWHAGTLNPASFASASHSHSAADITSGTLAVGRGGTGASSLTGVLFGNGTGAFTAVASSGANQVLRRNTGNTGYEWVTISGGGSPVGTSRSIGTGTGLTGGGDLSSNRTLAINTSVVPQKNTSDTIVGPWTFNPSSVGAPFLIGSNALGRLVAGLNADQLDGYDATAFPRKSESAIISGTWSFTNFALNSSAADSSTEAMSITFRTDSGTPLWKLYQRGRSYPSEAGWLSLYHYDGVTFKHALRMKPDGTVGIALGGYLGVGTTSPGYQLDVSGIANATSLYINGAEVITSARAITNVSQATLQQTSATQYSASRLIWRHTQAATNQQRFEAQLQIQATGPNAASTFMLRHHRESAGTWRDVLKYNASSEELFLDGANVYLNNGQVKITSQGTIHTPNDYVVVGASGVARVVMAHTSGAHRGRITYDGNGTFINTNAYWDGANWYRDDTTLPSFAIAAGRLTVGRVEFRVAPAGAGSITWAYALSLMTNGNVQVGTTTDLGRKLGVKGDAIVAGASYSSVGDTATLYLGDGNHYVQARHGGPFRLSSVDNLVLTSAGFDGLRVIGGSGGTLYGDWYNDQAHLIPAVVITTSAPSSNEPGRVGTLWCVVS